MNQTQIKYLRQRIGERISKLENEVNTKYRPKLVTNEDRLEMIKDGRATLRDKVPSNSYYGSDITNFYEFPNDYKEVEEQRQEATNKLKAYKNELLDQVVLGDADQALELLKSIDNYEV